MHKTEIYRPALEREFSPQILVADDEESMRSFVGDVLRSEGYTVTEYDPLAPQPELLSKAYDVAVLDIAMPGCDGFELRRRMLSVKSDTEFIFMTGFPDEEKYRLALELGVIHFIIKPFPCDQIRWAVKSALKRKNFFGSLYEAKGVSLQLRLIGESRSVQEVRRRIEELGPTMLPVLISGESGTGKEIVARALHSCSERKNKPFIAVNCGALSPSLIESELFGYVRGAFTGAERTKYGFFEAAHGGTLFLDEIAELPLELQSKFLRVLDTGEFVRIGDTKTRKVDVRIISATNRDLQRCVQEGTFRSDLYYRLRGSTIFTPPLREHKEDIPELVRFFAGPGLVITESALKAFMAFEWPGNVRELSMMVAAVKACCRKNTVDEADVKAVIRAHYGPQDSKFILPYQESKKRILHNFEVEYFRTLLSCVQNNVSRAAALARMDRKNLRQKLKSLGIIRTTVRSTS